MEDPSAITNVYGLYALIAIQLFGLIKIYVDRSTTKKERNEAIDALKTRQEELTNVVTDCKAKSDIIVILQKDIQRLQEEHSVANITIDRLNTNMVNLQLEVSKVVVSVSNLTDNVNRLTMTMDKVLDRISK